MKKVLNSTLKAKVAGGEIKKASEINLSLQAALNGGSLIPSGSKFQLVGIFPMCESGNFKPYQAMVVELENGTQIPLNVRTFCGVHFPYNDAEKRNIQEIDTENTFIKSGKDIITFTDENKDKVFTAVEPLRYKTLAFNSETSILDRSLLRYE